MSWNPGFNDTAGGFLNNTTNFDSPAGKKKSGSVKRLQNILPVVVRQIRDSNDEEFKLFGMPAPIVCIVGILKDFDLQSTKATYTVEDHTGAIKALWWLESDGDDTPLLPVVKEGAYVQVFGTIRVQDGHKNLMVLKMFPIDDCNIITTHLLEVINTRLQAEVMSKDTAQTIRENNPGATLANSMSMFDDNMTDNGQLNLSATQMKVFKILQADQTTAGPDRTSILSHFPQNQRREANEALEFLVNEGHAYSTIDNEHFKPTDA